VSVASFNLRTVYVFSLVWKTFRYFNVNFDPIGQLGLSSALKSNHVYLGK